MIDMKILRAAKIVFLIFLPQLGFYLSIFFASYFFTDDFIVPSLFFFIAPFPVSIYIGVKFGKNPLSKIGFATLCLVLVFTLFSFRLLTREEFMVPFVYRCKAEFSHEKLEEYRKEITEKYNNGTLELKGDNYRFCRDIDVYIADQRRVST